MAELACVVRLSANLIIACCSQTVNAGWPSLPPRIGKGEGTGQGTLPASVIFEPLMQTGVHLINPNRLN